MSQALQQEKHVLHRKLEMNELASGQREAELTADLAALKAELEQHHGQGRDRRRDESEQLTQLANHNQRLVEQLAEVSLYSHPVNRQVSSLLTHQRKCFQDVIMLKKEQMCVGIVCVCVTPHTHRTFSKEKCRLAGLGSHSLNNSLSQLFHLPPV